MHVYIYIYIYIYVCVCVYGHHATQYIYICRLLSWVRRLHATHALLVRNVLIHPQETVLTPRRAPPVLQYPVFGAIASLSVTNGCNPVVQISATRAGHYTTRVELKCHVSSIHHHGHGLVRHRLHESCLSFAGTSSYPLIHAALLDQLLHLP
jgi:hypothetical protein